VTDTGADLAQTSPEHPETMEDFRATATAFSQLTGVLGGFSMTILVLILALLEENKTARDWTVALLLLAATAYIFSSGVLANSMNVGAFAKWNFHPKEIRSVQQRVFRFGIGLFHIGNTFLPVAIVITVYQESLWIGLVASIVIVLLAATVVAINFDAVRLILWPPKDEGIHDDTGVSGR
jgi:hypothetical protein